MGTEPLNPWMLLSFNSVARVTHVTAVHRSPKTWVMWWVYPDPREREESLVHLARAKRGNM